MRGWVTSSEEETRELGRRLAEGLGFSGIVLLSGTLGCGKTVLAKGAASALDIDPSQVQSPTFTLMREHQGSRGSLTHIDLYRLEPAEVEGAGIDEALEAPGLRVVEWAERLGHVPAGAVSLRVSILEDGRRRIELTSHHDEDPFGSEASGAQRGKR